MTARLLFKGREVLTCQLYRLSEVSQHHTGKGHQLGMANLHTNLSTQLSQQPADVNQHQECCLDNFLLL